MLEGHTRVSGQYAAVRLMSIVWGGADAVNRRQPADGGWSQLPTLPPDAYGIWHVATRSKPLQPYFESGFPYGHDQWISAAGTSWSAMALSMAMEAPSRTASR